MPEVWKLAHVTPIYKKGGKSNPGNYRPVSLTCVVGKLLERLIYKRIIDHLELNKLIKGSQHGFRSRMSCATNLVNFLNFVTGGIDEGNPVDVVYFDFSKAFDKVSISKLLVKLKAYGIKGKLLKWISNWLTGRKQCTVLNGHQSEWVFVKSGVPQGSVLGPLLFIIFIDDIDDCANTISMLSKFADDTKAGHIINNNDDIEKLQACIDRMADWANKWAMKFNVEKCKVLHFGHNNLRHIYSMNNAPLSEFDNEKDIGVLVTNTLKPSKHCKRAAGVGMGVLYQILRSFHYRDKYTFPML